MTQKNNSVAYQFFSSYYYLDYLGIHFLSVKIILGKYIICHVSYSKEFLHFMLVSLIGYCKSRINLSACLALCESIKLDSTVDIWVNSVRFGLGLRNSASRVSNTTCIKFYVSDRLIINSTDFPYRSFTTLFLSRMSFHFRLYMKLKLTMVFSIL